jgi:hypothetical protein
MLTLSYLLRAVFSGVFVGNIAYTATLDVSLDTSSLIGHAAGPFSIAFQLTDGNGYGDANNTATITNFMFGGGKPSGSATVLGGAGGSLGSSVILDDSQFLNFFTQSFVPGTYLAFRIVVTTNMDTGGIPDGLSFSILDSTGTEIPTLGGPSLNVFLSLDLNTPTPTLTNFASDPSRPPKAGGPPVAIPTPTVTPVVVYEYNFYTAGTNTVGASFRFPGFVRDVSPASTPIPSFTGFILPSPPSLVPCDLTSNSSAELDCRAPTVHSGIFFFQFDYGAFPSKLGPFTGSGFTAPDGATPSIGTVSLLNGQVIDVTGQP